METGVVHFVRTVRGEGHWGGVGNGGEGHWGRRGKERTVCMTVSPLVVTMATALGYLSLSRITSSGDLNAQFVRAVRGEGHWGWEGQGERRVS